MRRGNTQSARKEAYRRLMVSGQRRLRGEEPPDPLAELVAEFQARRAGGEKVSIRAFCGQHHLSQKQFEARLHAPPPPEIGLARPEMLAYYHRPEVQQALYLWARGRRLALHYARGVVGQGFRTPEDVAVLAAACNTTAPTFHASVGRYKGTQLLAFELVAEVDEKGDWRACFRATRPLVEGLHRAEVPFLVKFSGHSSAHVLVPVFGADYREIAGHFLNRVRSIMRRTGRLDLSFRDPQHFLRMPYALHERTGLVSLPLTVAEYESFHPDMARPENVTVDLTRLERALGADNRGWVMG